MRDASPALAAAIAAPETIVHTLFWLTAKAWSDGSVATFGFSTMAEDRSLTIGGESRTYYGAGALLEAPPLVLEVGLSVRAHTISLSALPAEVALAVRGYDLEQQPVEIHTAYFNPATNTFIGAVRDFAGVVDTCQITEAADGGPATVTISFLGATHVLAKGLPMMKNAAAQAGLDPDDAIYRYGDLVGVKEPWGEKRADGPGGSSTPAAPEFASSGGDIEGVGT